MATGRHPFGLLVKRALASNAMVARLDGEPVVVFGCVPQGSSGAPWLLATDRLEGLSSLKSLLRNAPFYMDHWAAFYPDGLSHRVYAKNHLHIAFLRRLGCLLSEPAPYGPLKAQFMEFSYV